MTTAAAPLPRLPIAGIDEVRLSGPGWATRWAMAARFGRIVQRRDRESWQVVVQHEGQRFRIGMVRITGTSDWLPISDRATAEHVLRAIRERYASGLSLEVAVAPFLRRGVESTAVEACVERWIVQEEARCASGDLSPSTFENSRRIAARNFARWHGWDVNTITYADLEDWRLELGESVSAKTARNILSEFRRLLKWLHRRGELHAVPEFPAVPVDRKARRILTLDEQQAIIGAIHWRYQGVFRAMAHTLRPGEARAFDLFGWKAPYMIVQRAAKGAKASAPIRGLKERDYKVIGADEGLCEWIEWRLDRATASERLQRAGVLMFPNWRARNPLRIWSDWSIRDEWMAASKRAGVDYVPPYPSTRHTTATALLRGGAALKAVQKLLGHAAAASTEHYAMLAGADAQNLVRDLKDRGR